MINNKTRLNTTLFTNISSGAIDNIMGPNNHAIVPYIGDDGDYDTEVLTREFEKEDKSEYIEIET